MAGSGKARRVSLAFVGPESSGKTCALGYLAHQMGGFPDEEHEICRSLARDFGRPDLQHGWMLDTLPSERDLGKTIVPSMVTFSSDDVVYTAVDTPGHDAYSMNMLSVLSLVDVAVLVVSGSIGDFAVSHENDRVREIALSCFTMGIKHVGVLVSKMDDRTIKEPANRFEEIRQAVTADLNSVGYGKKDVPFAPISGRFGFNITHSSNEFPWHRGKTALDLLSELGPIARDDSKPLRLPIWKVYSHPEAGTVVTGRVVSGSLCAGTELLIAPGGLVGEAESLMRDGCEADEAAEGDTVAVGLGDTIEASQLRRGMVVSACADDPVSDAETFLAQVVVLDRPGAICPGYCPSVLVGTASAPCEFEELISVFERKTPKDVQAKPASVRSGQVVHVLMRARAPLVVEAYETCPALGRLVVRDHRRIVGVGIVKEVYTRHGRKGGDRGG